MPTFTPRSTEPRGARRPSRVLAAVVAVAAVAAVAACQPVAGDKVALRQPARAPQIWDLSDPAVVVANGKTFLFGSTNRWNVPFKPVDLATATTATTRDDTEAMPNLPSWANGAKGIWAPSVTGSTGAWVMYFAAARTGATDTNNDRCIGIARSARIGGPYVASSQPVYCGLPRETGSNPWGRGALDPEVFTAPGGRRYLLVSLSRTKDNIGVVALNADGSVTGGVNATPSILASQRLNWHDGTDNGTLTSSTAFLENPSMVYDAATQTYLLFYSAGRWSSAAYTTGFARCSAPTGPCTLDARGPFLVGGNGRSAPGGLTVFTDPSGVRRAAYATWKAGSENQSGGQAGALSRQTTIARLVVSGSDPATQVVRLDP